MALRLVDPTAEVKIKALIYGDTKLGKTRLLGTAMDDERTSPICVLDFEGNAYPTLYGSGADVYSVRSWSEWGEAYQMLKRNPKNYKSVGIDSITEVNLWALMEVLKDAGANADSEENSKRMIGPFGEPDKAYQSDYGIILTQMRRFLRRFRDLPLHLFYTALPKTTGGHGDDGPEITFPRMLGQMQREVGALMSCQCALTMADMGRDPTTKKKLPQRRALLLHSHSNYQVGLRTDWSKPISEIPEYIFEPTIKKLLDAIQPKPPVVESKPTKELVANA